MAREIKKAGVDCDTNQADAYINGWKRKYFKAAAFLIGCHNAIDTFGFVETPFGRRRHFQPSVNKAKRSGQNREAANFPIQGTVADLLSTALYNMQVWKDSGTCPAEFNLLLPVHDAIMAEVKPEHLYDYVNLVLPACMSYECEIPGTGKHLDLDIDLYYRWGVKLTPEQKEELNFNHIFRRD